MDEGSSHVDAETVIEAKSVVKKFGKLVAVDDLHLRLERGITYGMLGPNGSGKTTLIRMLLGIIPVTSGEITVLGKRIPDRQVRSKIGYMPQHTALYDELTVKENITFCARLMDAQPRERVAEVIALVDLVDRSNSPVANLSGGMRRRVSLACALVHSPSLLFLDEPTVGVDPELRIQFWDHFRQLNQKGVTILVSTHILDEVERCDRIGMLQNGKLLADGTSDDLRTKAGTENLERAYLYFSTR